MPAKKAASKKRKKAATKKASVRKKAAAGKRKVSKKISKKAAKKKAASPRKKASRKKVSKKKAAKKKTASKKVAKKKASKKKVAKKKAPKKKVAKKKAARKKVSKKKVARKASKKVTGKTSKKKVSKKKAKAVSRKKPAKKAASRRKPSRSRGDILSAPIHGIEPYKPKRGEEYMSAEQLDHFEQILTSWKRELMNEVDRTVHHMQDEAANFPDPSDRATQESEFGLELRTRDRERKLLRKINAALSRIDDGSYGYCEETGEEIGLKRLEARPVATLCLEAQERREMSERQYRDRDDRYR